MKTIIIALIITASLSAVEFNNLTSDYWQIKCSDSNLLIVEEDSTFTLIGLPKSINDAKEINSWLAKNSKKELGQLIVTDSSTYNQEIINILDPMVIHTFSSIISMITPNSEAGQNYSLVQIGSFNIADATPRMSIMYPGVAFSKTNLIVYSNDDKIAYFGNILSGGETLETTKESKILSWKRSIEQSLETISAEYYIPYTGDNISPDNYQSTIQLLNKK